ncbi:hypothetical protein KAI92_00715 [Candidatus Parcubacteria bacterium]|nr:hypothetical protein [Candidatus Parcubacteria bacterium]
MNFSDTPNLNYLSDEIVEIFAEYIPAIFPAFAVCFAVYVCSRLLISYTRNNRY